MRNNPQQGGGIFARYAGANMSPVPPGYLESAAQEANIYANMGANIANIMMKQDEMNLKGKEIAAQQGATAAKNRELYLKETEASTKANIDRQRADTDRLTARFGVVKDAQTALNNEFGAIQEAINLHLSNKTPLSPSEFERLKSRKAQIMLDLEAGNKSMMDFMRKMEGPVEGPSIPGGGYVPTFGMPPSSQTINTTGQKPRSVVGFNKPSEPASGGSEGDGETDVYPVSEEEAKGGTPPASSEAAPAAPAEPPAPKTTSPETPTRQIFRSYLNLPVGLKENIALRFPDGNQQRVTGKFVSQKSPDGKKMMPLLELNSSAFVFDNNGNIALSKSFENASPEDQQNMLSQVRTLHLMSWAMNKRPDLLAKINPNSQEMAFVKESYLDEDNKDDLINIARAYAYASRDRDPNAPMDWARGELDAAFVNDFQVSTNEFIESGANMFTVGSSVGFIESEQNAARERLRAAGISLPGLTKRLPSVDNLKKNPYTVEVENAAAKLQEASRNSEGVVGMRAESAKAAIASAAQELQAAQAKAAAWENENGSASVKAKADIITMNIENYDRQLGNLKALAELGEAYEKSTERMVADFQTWVGINPGDKERYWGYVASGIKNFRGYPTTINGRPALLSAGEFRNWALREPSRGVNVKTTAGMYAGQWPKLATLQDPNVQHSVARASVEMRNLINPLNQLHILFSELNQMGVAQRVKNSILTSKYAASEAERAALISQIRTAFIGGGNPSNFEQEILRSAVPDPGMVFTFTENNLNRLRTLTVAIMLSHARDMEVNGLEMTEDSLAAYNKAFSNIIGKKITMDDFMFFRSLTERYNQEYQNIPTADRESYGKSVTPRVLQEIEARILERNGTLEKK